MKQPRLRFTIANTDWDALRRSAQQQERRRIAQELHDTLPQGVTGIPQPSPNEDEVSVKVHATSVTPAELKWFTLSTFPLASRAAWRYQQQEQKKDAK